MAQAARESTTSRRNFLRTASAAPLIAGIPATAALADVPHENPDALLIRLGRELVEAWREERALEAKYGYEESEAINAEFDRASKKSHALVDRIESEPAFTLEGLRVKAVVVLWCCGGDLDLYEAPTTDLRLSREIVRSLLTISPFAMA